MNDRDQDPQVPSQIALSGFVLDLAAGELLTAEGQVAALRRQALEVLLVLGRRTGHVVSKDELMRLVWPVTVVGEGSLTQAIAEIRRALNDKDHRLVRNVARRGYMLVPQASASAAPVPALQSGEDREPSRPRRIGRSTISLAIAGFLAVIAVSIGFWPQMFPGDRKDAASPLSIVVLPLAQDSGDPDGEWFADVLHADLTSELGQISGTTVISRETAATLKSAQPDPRAVAQQLQVRYVVRGSLRRNGERVHLRLAMIDGKSGAQHWTNQFDLDRAELRQSLIDIARQVARSLNVQMHRSSGERSARLAPEQVRADDVAMQGFAIYFRGMSPDNLRLAGEKFETALRMDPKSIRAWGGVQSVMGVAGGLAWIPRDRAIARLEEAARQLHGLDADDYYAYSAKMFLAFLKADWDSLLVTGTAAIERFPSYPGAENLRSLALAALGDFDACLDASRRALRLGPRDTSVGISYMVMATCHFMRGEYRQAADNARAAHQANPTLPSPPVLLAASLVRMGEMTEARALISEYLRLHPDYQAEDIGKFLRGRHPRYQEGRKLVIESLRDAGMP